MKSFKLNVVVPAYNEALTLPELIRQLTHILSDFNYEIIIVNDGSSDNTLDVLKELHKQNNRIQYLSFSRNFGHQSALRAGLNYAQCDCVIMMDADLQHPVNLIPDMIKLWQGGAEIVNTIRQENQNQSWLKRKTSNLFLDSVILQTTVQRQSGSSQNKTFQD